MRLDKNDIQQLDRKYRLNLINSLSGIKPANLIGTRSKDGIDNVAVFSSVVHLGSKPAQFGMIMRPQIDNVKDTFRNIEATQFYTINHITTSFIKKAHYTSAKLEADQSEFDVMNIERAFLDDFYAPFVKESPIKIGLEKLKSIDLPNGCIFMIGNVVMIDIDAAAINELGQIDLAMHNCAGIAGLNTYYALEKMATFPYVRTNEIPNFYEEG